MALNTKQKMMLGICGVALAGLAVDRLCLQEGSTGPASAAALVVPSIEMGTGTPRTVLTKAVRASEPLDVSPQQLEDEGSLARRLSRVAEQEKASGPAIDAFTMAPTWVIRTAEAEKPAAVKVPDAADPVKFAAVHQLTVLMQGTGRSGLAVIDGSPRRVGDVVDGWVVESLSARAAVMRHGSSRVELKLPDPAVGKSKTNIGSDR